MKNPPIKITRVPNEFIKRCFENKTKSDWEYIKQKYNANYVVVHRIGKLI